MGNIPVGVGVGAGIGIVFGKRPRRGVEKSKRQE